MRQLGYVRFCAVCGADVIFECPNCQKLIIGAARSMGKPHAYRPPDFCSMCGAPFPWASRQARIYQLENLLDEEGLDPADRLIAREQLEALLDADVPEEEQKRRWDRVKSLAPGLMQSGARIIESIATAEIKRHLGL